MYDGLKGIDQDECVVSTVNGQSVVFESFNSNKAGTSYVRFIDQDKNELLYYSYDEWVEDPQLVMGCIMAAIQNGAKKA
jgi:hypothetical protein